MRCIDLQMYVQVVMHLVGLLPENPRHLDLEEQEVHGLWVQSFGAEKSFVEVVDELIEARNCLPRK